LGSGGLLSIGLVGEATRCSVCGRSGRVPKRLSLHIAFRTDLPDLLHAAVRLRAANVVPLDFWGQPTDEPVVLGWMPAASLYFRDPDGNMLELLSMLADPPQPELGIVGLSRWNEIRESGEGQTL
jgi:lactoylglutathione lyase